MFALYYAHMGWELPTVLWPPYHHQNGPIADRTPAAAISTADEYVLTHLVYVPSFYGYSRTLEGRAWSSLRPAARQTADALVAAQRPTGS